MSLLAILADAAQAAPSLGGPADIWGHIVSDFSNITEPAAFRPSCRC